LSKGTVRFQIGDFESREGDKEQSDANDCDYRADDKGRVPAVEVMIATNYIRDCIINADKTRLIRDAIAAGTSQYGMQTFDQSLFDLYTKNLITLDEALLRASNADEFKLRIQGVRSASDSAREEMERQMVDFERYARK